MSLLLPTQETDAELIARSLAQPVAFGVVFDRHWPGIHRYCASRAGAVGEDLAAEVFRIAFDARRGFRPEFSDARPWLIGVATNLLRAHFRGMARAERSGRRAMPPPSPTHSDDALGRVEAARMAPRLIAALAGRRRRIATRCSCTSGPT